MADTPKKKPVRKRRKPASRPEEILKAVHGAAEAGVAAYKALKPVIDLISGKKK